MVRHSVFRWPMALLALAWAGSAHAAASSLFATGDVEQDFPDKSKSVTVVPGQSMSDMAQQPFITNAGLINGYLMKDIRLSYDQKTDTLSVGVNFYGIAGDTDGSKDGLTNPLTTALGGSNPPHIGGDKSIAIAFTPVTAAGTNANPVVVAGVPANKSSSPAGSLDGFTVATFKGLSPTVSGSSFGTNLTNNVGQLAYDPSSAHPDFEFTIKNFSKIPGLNALTNGFYVSAYTGTQSTLIAGKSYIADTQVAAPLQGPQNLEPPPGTITVPPPPPPHTTPEPTTILAWGLVAGGAGWRVRRRLRPSARS